MGATPAQAFGVLLMILAFALFGLALAGGGVLAGVGAAILCGLSSAVSMKAKSGIKEAKG